ncbi:claudin-12 isoform X3 [Cinclus cinclus]|uniref:claudin-12 isoform X3 n=1 Tax=Cinclus cinclus TaxID=127875 RepID=UPI002E0D466D
MGILYLKTGAPWSLDVCRKKPQWANMGCRDVHAATVLAFLSGTASVAGLLAAVLLPNWRQMRLYTYNKNERNVTVYTGLWIKCARFDGSRDCVIYDPQWYTAVDQLDLRVLQFALPLSCHRAQHQGWGVTGLSGLGEITCALQDVLSAGECAAF